MRQYIFIGHGRSLVWLQLKNFLADRLHLDCDEFNAVSVAGRATVARLQEMLEGAWFAFLVMTGEDLHADGAAHARDNVVHEAGLFQGRLGFERAIVLLENGCAEFSNIHGLTTIRFPKGDVSPAFEEIRRVLERETARASGSQPQRAGGAGSHEEQLAQDQQRIAEEIQYLSDDEREIIAYLLAHNQKMFTNTPDCGHASTLVSKGIVVSAVREGQPFTYYEMPFMIPEHVWAVLKQHLREFPYAPPPRGETERHPWRRGWME
jgi:hypothetical protein